MLCVDCGLDANETMRIELPICSGCRVKRDYVRPAPAVDLEAVARVYLCARYSQHPEMRERAADLAAIGYDVQTEWITGKHDGMADSEAARIDLEEVRQASIVISFTEGSAGRNRGGRHVEFGAALALGKRCIVVGPREHVFHSHPNVEHYETWPGALAVLRRHFGGQS